MEPSILKSVKKNLGLAPDYDVFDEDVVMYINTALTTLNQLGVGPVEGFSITSDVEEWNDFLDDGPSLDSSKTFIYLSVRLIFDPPGTSYGLKAFQDQLEEIGWRLNVRREGTEWADPMPVEVVDNEW